MTRTGLRFEMDVLVAVYVGMQPYCWCLGNAVSASGRPYESGSRRTFRFLPIAELPSLTASASYVIHVYPGRGPLTTVVFDHSA